MMPSPLLTAPQDAPLAVSVTAEPAAIGAFVAYLLVVLAIGVFATRFSSTGVSEFFVGGRKMHRFVVALSAVVSGRSAWLLLAVSGMAYTRGASAIWTVAGYTVVELLLFLFYAPRLRRFAERYDTVTLPDFFDTRLGGSPAVRLVLAGIILIFMVGYVASQFVGGGKAFAGSFGVSQTSGMLLTAGIVLAYTVMGGFLAVSLTDMVQACLMVVALVALPIAAIVSQGGPAQFAGELRAIDPTLLDPTALAVGAAIGFLGIGLGSPGNPHIIVRYLSIADARQLRYAGMVATAWNVVMGAGAVAVGLAGRVAFPDVALLPGGDVETVYPALAQRHLPPVLFGIVVSSIFAAIMSTADSQLLVGASALVRDVYQKVVRAERPVPPHRLVWLSRAAVVGIVLVSIVVGMLADQLVFWLVLFAWAGLGAALGPTSLLAIFWRGTTRAGVLAGLVAGAGTVIAWYFTPALKALIYELIPGFAVGLVVTAVVSLLTRPVEDVGEMFHVMAGDGTGGGRPGPAERHRPPSPGSP
jgi:SSS family solute:Na+ symporter